MQGWRVAYFPTVMDGPVARFRLPGFDGFEIAAGREGVSTSFGHTKSLVPYERALPAFEASERVHAALAAAYRRRPLGGPEDAFETIRAALGEGWELERPRFGTPWPGEEPS